MLDWSRLGDIPNFLNADSAGFKPDHRRLKIQNYRERKVWRILDLGWMAGTGLSFKPGHRRLKIKDSCVQRDCWLWCGRIERAWTGWSFQPTPVNWRFLSKIFGLRWTGLKLKPFKPVGFRCAWLEMASGGLSFKPTRLSLSLKAYDGNDRRERVHCEGHETITNARRGLTGFAATGVDTWGLSYTCSSRFMSSCVFMYILCFCLCTYVLAYLYICSIHMCVYIYTLILMFLL